MKHITLYGTYLVKVIAPLEKNSPSNRAEHQRIPQLWHSDGVRKACQILIRKDEWSGNNPKLNPIEKVSCILNDKSTRTRNQPPLIDSLVESDQNRIKLAVKDNGGLCGY